MSWNPIMVQLGGEFSSGAESSPTWAPETYQVGVPFPSVGSGGDPAKVTMDGVSTITIASITMLEPGSEPEIVNTGTPNHAVLHFRLPKGDTGAGITGVTYLGQNSDGSIRYALELSDGNQLEFTIPAVEQTADKHYVHQQRTAAKDWVIAHGLGKYPSARVLDTAGTTVLGEIEYTDENNLILHFSAAFAGAAYLN